MPGRTLPIDRALPTAPGRAPDRIDATTDLSDIDPMAPSRAAAPALPTTRYQLLVEIARGGMGVVWSATDTMLDREVAVKVLQDRYAPVAHRFADEARITARLQHPGIPPVHDYGTLPDGRTFLAMKLIKGRTLDDLLQNEVVSGRIAPANPDEALWAIRQAMHPSRQQFVQAVRLFTWVFDKKPGLADNLAKRHRADAARCAVLVADGKDKEMPNVEAAERDRLHGLALKWLRAELEQMTTEAKDPRAAAAGRRVVRALERRPGLSLDPRRRGAGGTSASRRRGMAIVLERRGHAARLGRPDVPPDPGQTMTGPSTRLRCTH